MRNRLRSNELALLALLPLAGCAGRELLPTRVESEWVQPQVDATAQAAARCLHGEPNRFVEVEASRDGAARGYVLPYPGEPAEQECVDREVANLRTQPSTVATVAVQSGGGRLADPKTPRLRALSLRARALEQLPPVSACNAARLVRHPGSTARVALQLEVGHDGDVTRAGAADSTADAEATRCVLAAARALQLPPIEGAYRYSYWLGPKEVIVGAPDGSPVDPADLDAAMARVAPSTEACLRGFHAQRLLLVLTVGEAGGVTAARVDRPRPQNAEDDEDADAERCLLRAAKTVRLPPFDGPPQVLTVPFTLR